VTTFLGFLAALEWSAEATPFSLEDAYHAIKILLAPASFEHEQTARKRTS